MLKVIARYYNYIQLAGWAFVFIHTLSCCLHYSMISKADPTQTLNILKVFQTLQFMDLVFTMLGATSGSVLSGSMQVIARNITAHYYMYPSTCFCSLRNTLIPWCIAEIIRYSYYINKNMALLKFLRYNAFIILYPLGVLGEIRVINYYVNEITGNEIDKHLARAFQVALVVGLCFLYIHMFKQRSKQQTKTQEFPQVIVLFNILQIKMDGPITRHKRE